MGLGSAMRNAGIGATSAMPAGWISTCSPQAAITDRQWELNLIEKQRIREEAERRSFHKAQGDPDWSGEVCERCRSLPPQDGAPLPVLAEAPFSEVGWQRFAIYNHGCKIAVYGKLSPDFQKRAAEV